MKKFEMVNMLPCLSPLFKFFSNVFSFAQTGIMIQNRPIVLFSKLGIFIDRMELGFHHWHWAFVEKQEKT